MANSLRRKPLDTAISSTTNDVMAEKLNQWKSKKAPTGASRPKQTKCRTRRTQPVVPTKSKMAIMLHNTVPSKVDMQRAKPFQLAAGGGGAKTAAAAGHHDTTVKRKPGGEMFSMFFSPGNGMGGTMHGNSTMMTPTAATSCSSSATENKSSSAERLGNVIEGLKKQIIEKQEELQRSQQCSAEKETEINELRNCIEEFQAVSDKQEEDLVLMERQLKEKECELEQVQEDMTMADEKVEEYEKMLGDMEKKRKQEQEQEKESHEQRMMEVEVRVGEAQEEAVEVKAELSAAKESFKAEKLQQMEKFTEIEKEFASLTASKEIMSIDLERLRETLKEKDSTCASESMKVQRYEKKIQETSEELDMLKKKVLILTHEVDQHKSKVEGKNIEIEQMKDDMASTTVRHGEAIATIKRTATEMSDAIVKLQREKTSDAEVSATIQKGQSAEIKNLREEIERTKKKNNFETKQTSDAHQVELSSLQETTKKAMAVQQKMFATMEQEMQALKLTSVAKMKELEQQLATCANEKDTLAVRCRETETLLKTTTEKKTLVERIVQEKDAELTKMTRALAASQEEAQAHETCASDVMQERAEMEAAKDEELADVRAQCDMYEMKNKEMMKHSEEQSEQIVELQRVMKEYMENAKMEIAKASQDEKVCSFVVLLCLLFLCLLLYAEVVAERTPSHLLIFLLFFFFFSFFFFFFLFFFLFSPYRSQA